MSDSAAPWTVQSMEFSRLEHWSGEPFPSPGDLPNPGIKPGSPAFQAESLPAEPQGKLHVKYKKLYNKECIPYDSVYGKFKNRES